MLPLDLSHLLSEQAKARKGSKLKSCVHYKNEPNFGFLAGGLPLPSYFAWEAVSASTRKPPFEGGLSGISTAENQLSFTVSQDSTDLDIPLSASLQYAVAIGPAPLRQFLIEHTKVVHKIPYEEWELATTVGNTQSWDACIRTFCNQDDSILVEKYSFSSAMETAALQGIRLVPMDVDESGILPEKLESKLFKMKAKGEKLPKIIYCIPTGQNPTGICISGERRKHIYDIALKYDLVIVEDEPYYFLQLDPYVAPEKRGSSTKSLTNSEFLESMVPSFLNFDTEGRVVRLDSFSKVLAPGSRLGWITCQKKLMERFLRNFESTFQTPSGFSSSIIYGTLSRWGQQGYIEWLKALRVEYTWKRNLAIDFCRKYLPEALSRINAPNAGMFFIVSFDTSKHPEFATKYNSDPLAVEAAIYEATIENKAILVPGSWFEVREKDEEPSTVIFFRGTYAATEIDVLEKGIQRFGKAVREVFSLHE